MKMALYFTNGYSNKCIFKTNGHLLEGSLEVNFNLNPLWLEGPLPSKYIHNLFELDFTVFGVDFPEKLSKGCAIMSSKKLKLCSNEAEVGLKSRSKNSIVIRLPRGAVIFHRHILLLWFITGYPGDVISPDAPSISPPHAGNSTEIHWMETLA